MILASILTLASLTATVPTIEVWRASPQSPRMVLAPDPTSADAAIHILFRAGAADDGLQEGLTRFAQYTLLHGQDGAPYAALDAALYGAGADLIVGTSVRECSFTLLSPKSSFDAAAARLVKQVLTPKVSSDAGIERGRKLAMTDVLQVGGTEWMNAFVAASVLITEGVDGGGDYNNPIWGDPQTIREIPGKSVKAHIAEKLAPANAVVIVTGAFNPQKIKALVGATKGGKERALRRPDIVKYLPFERDAATSKEVHLQLQVVDVTDAKSAAVVHVLASYLHDRLFWKLRKSGHVYSPGVTTSFQEWLDFILVWFEVTPGSTNDLRAVMMDEIDALAAGTVDDASLKRATAIALGRLEQLEREPASFAWALAARARGVTTVGPEVRSAVMTVDKAALVDAAESFLSRSRAVSFVFGTSRRDGKRPTGAGDDE